MADGCVLLRSVLDVDGKSFDVVLSGTCLSWGHVGIEESGLGKKNFEMFSSLMSEPEDRKFQASSIAK